jgi:hypothetical protein
VEFYCGPDYFPKWLRKKLSKKFNTACAIHDEMYEQKVITRQAIDLIFLDDMLKKCENKRDKLLAYSLYWMVRAFGWSRYGRG